MAIPRELTLSKSKDEQYILMQYPIKEVKRYREKLLVDQKGILLKDGTNKLNDIRGKKLLI